MGQKYSYMLCDDIFKLYMDHMHYKDRLKAFMISKDVKKIYEKLYPTDIIAGKYLQEMKSYEDFFLAWLDHNFKKYLDTLNEKDIILLYNFMFGKRSIKEYCEKKYVVMYGPCIGNDYVRCVPNDMVCIEIDEDINTHIEMFNKYRAKNKTYILKYISCTGNIYQCNIYDAVNMSRFIDRAYYNISDPNFSQFLSNMLTDPNNMCDEKIFKLEEDMYIS
jgi:hypothetical protein